MARKPEPPKAPPSISESVNDLVDSVRSAAGKAMDNTGRTVTSVSKLSTIPPDTIELIAELPKVMLAMADMIERANNVIDRVERLTAVADPALNTLDAVLPPLVDVTNKLSDVQRGVNKLPGVSHLRKATGLSNE
ncbi:hypothetical protein HWD35_06725 [Tsukamurella tyrosinosolvens]|uniref:Uncharacterized protein n=1 Tax=Tsukamurella tyrosinosolvens TaxID=57704 RepID=A0A1H4Z862_TSUTY|nr:hypothetical protein [Tsukamurella tyrosinosolvens]AUN41655.1 hypothetical protein ASU32_17915 [Tsukamurella tyrosinosolvens]KXO90850.1 hypothetical protein AXK58_22670 [Tsukamurella tyrosinosolvens]KXP07041.1 hypothetical protein AXK59_02775 [Tsukamurella tyrosinosolvens]KZL98242.1 hypothetical protein AXX05_04925 [Tsukamurella tyrosinosolvens]MCA4994397.1 hypothetical protein [Tsukamurella tyrosinosolvens]